MTTRELLEMASLDALGLLDESEREAFEREYRASSPGVQRQVRREQGRLAVDDSLLPQVDPPTGLRDRVLAAVREAIRLTGVESTSDVLARLVPAAVTLRRNVSPLWRAACIGFATATIVLLTAGYSIQREWRAAQAAAQSGSFLDFVQKMGPEFPDVLLDPRTDRVTFTPASAQATGTAVILFDPEGGNAYLVFKDLPVIEGQYSLAIVDHAGRVQQTLARFGYKGGIGGWPFEAGQMAPGVTLAILTPNSDAPHLVSQPA